MRGEEEGVDRSPRPIARPDIKAVGSREQGIALACEVVPAASRGFGGASELPIR